MFSLDRIALGTDFGDAAARAARWITEHFAPRAHLDLVHALDARRPPGFLVGAFPHLEQTLETLACGAGERLSELARTLDPRRPGTILERDGAPADALLAAAERVEADMIAVAEHGRRRGLGRLLGSVPDRLARETDRPLLVVRGVAERPPRRILVSLADSPEAAETLDWARYLAELHRARLLVLHVESCWYADQVRLHLNDREADDMAALQRRQGRSWLAGLIAAARLDAVDFESRVESGQPGVEILRAERAFDAELTICGLRGSGRATPFLGSVARFVLQKGRAPFLGVPRPQPSMKSTDSDTISGVGEAPS
ncbi:MAG: universal stress protein [Planctomycetes bacterium]|nr:universal stress protein [Planctomycetota bacterium]